MDGLINEFSKVLANINKFSSFFGYTFFELFGARTANLLRGSHVAWPLDHSWQVRTG
jgi:hypothetical protein